MALIGGVPDSMFKTTRKEGADFKAEADIA